MHWAAFDRSEHPFIGVDADGRSGIAEHMIQGLITLVVAEMRQDVERRGFEEIVITNGNQIGYCFSPIYKLWINSNHLLVKQQIFIPLQSL